MTDFTRQVDIQHPNFSKNSQLVDKIDKFGEHDGRNSVKHAFAQFQSFLKTTFGVMAATNYRIRIIYGIKPSSKFRLVNQGIMKPF